MNIVRIILHAMYHIQHFYSFRNIEYVAVQQENNRTTEQSNQRIKQHSSRKQYETDKQDESTTAINIITKI